MKSKNYILFQHRDNKTSMWRKALIMVSSISLVELEKSPIVMPVELFSNIIKRGVPEAFFFRYLSDYPGRLKTLARFLSEFITILVLKVLRIRIFWICHNVDRETKHFHKITYIRRKMVARSAEKIFVMDSELVSYAQKVFPRYSDKIDYLTFGLPEEKVLPEKSKDVNERISIFVKKSNEKDNSLPFPGLFFTCIGRPGQKYLHFPLTIPLLDEAKRVGYKLNGIIVGPFHTVRDKIDSAFYGLSEDPRVFFHPEYVPFEESAIADQFDFFWRAYDDWSVSYTLYTAAALRKPVLALETGFVGKAVEHYKLGAILKKDFSNLKDALEQIQNWDPENADRFLETHSWEIAAKKIVKTLERLS
jgi:glycosyltransferase involved in cell wall biosynthesis